MANSWIEKNKQDIQKAITVQVENDSLLIHIDFSLCTESTREFLNLYIEELVDNGTGIYEDNVVIVLNENIQKLDDDLLSLLNISHTIGNTLNQKKENKMVVIAEDGTKIILNSDGTWEKAKEYTTPVGEYNLRQVSWGMSLDTVLKQETLDAIHNTEDLLVYQVQLAGNSADLYYMFIQNKLARAKYLFTHGHSDEVKFIYDFESIKENLTKKYGTPAKDDRFFHDDLYDDVPAEWGMAMGRGNLSFYTTWLINNTEITLALYGDNHEINFVIEYLGTEYSEMLDEKSEQNLMDDL